METLQDKRLEQTVMLRQISDVLRRGNSTDPPAYTLVLGAGASFGAVPTAKQMLGIAEKRVIHEDCIPAFIHHGRHGKKPEPNERAQVVHEFWKHFFEVNPALRATHPASSSPGKICCDADGIPDGTSVASVAEAYKALFDRRLSGGINDAASARDYLRSITLRRKSEGFALNGTHFFLASLLSLQSRGGEVAADGRPLYIGRRDFARTIFTTNFDPLLQISLQLFQILYYMTDQPDLLSPESLSTDDHPALHLFYAHGSVHRPFIANTEDEISSLRTNSSALAPYFAQHGVIVLGHSGWDDCLLNAMRENSRFGTNLYWLARSESSISTAAREFLCKTKGAFWVPITDGGEFMAKLHRHLCPGMAFTELLHNPIPFLRQSLSRVNLGEVAATAVTTTQESVDGRSLAGGMEERTSPEGFRLQVIALLDDSARHFTDVSTAGFPGSQLRRLEHQADLAYAEGRWSEALEAYGEIGLNLDVPIALRARALVRRGYCHAQEGRQEEAINCYSQAIELPDVPVGPMAAALVNRGVLRVEQGKAAEATVDFSHAINLPDVPAGPVATALINRGVQRAAQGNLTEALVDFSRAVNLPGTPAELIARALFHRGVANMEQGKHAEALPDFSIVIDLPSASAEQVAVALVNRGIHYSEIGEDAEAIANYTRAINLPGAPPEPMAVALHNRGIHFEEQGKLPEAVADLSLIIDLPGAPIEHLARALAGRGSILRNQGKYGEAVADCRRALDLPGAPVDAVATALFCLGLVSQNQGNISEAISHHVRLIDLSGAPTSQVAKALVNRGVCYAMQDRRADALADFSRVIHLPGAPGDAVTKALRNIKILKSPAIFSDAKAPQEQVDLSKNYDYGIGGFISGYGDRSTSNFNFSTTNDWGICGRWETILPKDR